MEVESRIFTYFLDNFSGVSAIFALVYLQTTSHVKKLSAFPEGCCLKVNLYF